MTGVFFALIVALAGCGPPPTGPVVIFADGAGWLTGSGPVERGLRDAGYTGRFERFEWTSFLGPGADHFLAARSGITTGRLARRITELRKADPTSQINVIGLSAGTAVVLGGVSRLPPEIQIDNIVLLSPSVSANRNLTSIMSHVRRNLYATCSRRDGLLPTIVSNADGGEGPPAGIRGFVMPYGRNEKMWEAYRRVVLIPWQSTYVAFSWAGGHATVTDSQFIAAVIAPRILMTDPYPADRSLAEWVASKS